MNPGSRRAGGAGVVGTFAGGFAAGLAWGIVARGFMRLLATAPEFTWAGTLGIIGTASVVGGLVALVRRARLTGRSRWWRLIGLPFVLLFTAAGALLLPGVVGVVMLLGRRRWLVVPGAALVGLTLWGVVVDDLGGSLTVRQWAGVVVMLGCLAVQGWAARELVRRWRPEAANAPIPAGAGPSSTVSGAFADRAEGEAGRIGSPAP